MAVSPLADSVLIVTSYIGLGSNLQNPLQQVTQAIQQLSLTEGIQVQRRSPWYGSKAIVVQTHQENQKQSREQNQEQPDYVNGVIEIQTTLSPEELLKALHDIENQHGRQRTIRWGARTLDLDILLYGQQIIDNPDLKIPHPRIAERAFVLAPLADLNATLSIPQQDKNETISAPLTVASLLSKVSTGEIWPLTTEEAF